MASATHGVLPSHAPNTGLTTRFVHNSRAAQTATAVLDANDGPCFAARVPVHQPIQALLPQDTLKPKQPPQHTQDLLVPGHLQRIRHHRHDTACRVQLLHALSA
jgi:hypothetical protein